MHPCIQCLHVPVVNTWKGDSSSFSMDRIRHWATTHRWHSREGLEESVRNGSLVVSLLKSSVPTFSPPAAFWNEPKPRWTCERWTWSLNHIEQRLGIVTSGSQRDELFCGDLNGTAAIAELVILHCGHSDHEKNSPRPVVTSGRVPHATTSPRLDSKMNGQVSGTAFGSPVRLLALPPPSAPTAAPPLAPSASCYSRTRDVPCEKSATRVIPPFLRFESPKSIRQRTDENQQTSETGHCAQRKSLSPVGATKFRIPDKQVKTQLRRLPPIDRSISQSNDPGLSTHTSASPRLPTVAEKEIPGKDRSVRTPAQPKAQLGFFKSLTLVQSACRAKSSIRYVRIRRLRINKGEVIAAWWRRMQWKVCGRVDDELSFQTQCDRCRPILIVARNVIATRGVLKVSALLRYRSLLCSTRCAVDLKRVVGATQEANVYRRDPVARHALLSIHSHLRWKQSAALANSRNRCLCRSIDVHFRSNERRMQVADFVADRFRWRHRSRRSVSTIRSLPGLCRRCQTIAQSGPHPRWLSAGKESWARQVSLVTKFMCRDSLCAVCYVAWLHVKIRNVRLRCVTSLTMFLAVVRRKRRILSTGRCVRCGPVLVWMQQRVAKLSGENLMSDCNNLLQLCQPWICRACLPGVSMTFLATSRASRSTSFWRAIRLVCLIARWFVKSRFRLRAPATGLSWKTLQADRLKLLDERTRCALPGDKTSLCSTITFMVEWRVAALVQLPWTVSAANVLAILPRCSCHSREEQKAKVQQLFGFLDRFLSTLRFIIDRVCWNRRRRRQGINIPAALSRRVDFECWRCIPLRTALYDRLSYHPHLASHEVICQRYLNIMCRATCAHVGTSIINSVRLREAGMRVVQLAFRRKQTVSKLCRGPGGLLPLTGQGKGICDRCVPLLACWRLRRESQNCTSTRTLNAYAKWLCAACRQELPIQSM